jgi:galactokinase
VSARLADRFRQLTGKSPDGMWQAPGRVNLIGEHTDYNGGFALPFAIDRRTTVAVGRRADRLVRCFSTAPEAAPGAAPETAPAPASPSAESRRNAPTSPHAAPATAPAGTTAAPTDEFADAATDLDSLSPAALPTWARYPVGVLWAGQHLGIDIPGLDIFIESTVPVGRGLSSSAALEAAVAVALNDLCHAGLDRRQLAQLCHRAETDFVGAPVGMLDPLAVLCGHRGHGLLIDFGTLAMESIPLAIGPLVVVDTHLRHANADGAYASRRRQCRHAAQRLGVADLGDATPDAIETQLDGDLRRRARHVVGENERVLEAARRLRTPTAAGIGDLLTASHASLRDDFQVSCPELDAVVEAALAAGARGARMTGAGFGGCAIVLGLATDKLAAALQPRFEEERQPTVFEVEASDGAGRVA